ncbi:MAG: hypothetical protein JXR32_05425 [Anaerolineaceae bacterium]|nr:hypothetical protein [Anaerolineaceae bacterium]
MTDNIWSIEQINSWYQKLPWLVGCTFIPSTAINQLEMWQADTFDLKTIQRELGWAADSGLNAVRVFLHDLAWQQDPEGFKKRIDRFLDTAKKNGILTSLVIFDDCWNSDPKAGEQPEPKPYTHNSGWVQSPGMKVVKDSKQWGRLESYVTDILTTFGKDERIFLWDLYNEPGNLFLPSLALDGGKGLKTMKLLGEHFLKSSPTVPLLKQAFEWARAAAPTQPLTASLWYLTPTMGSQLNLTITNLSDVITFHDYYHLEVITKRIAELKVWERPLICTEFGARTQESLITTHLPLFKKEKVGAFIWGLVSGKTQTIYSWRQGGKEPPPGTPWFHDLLHPDGKPYDPMEIKVIREQRG